MNSENFAVLLNIMGFITGATLYAMLLAMVLPVLSFTKTPESQDSANRPLLPSDLLPFATAILGLFWNLGALAAFAIRDFAASDPPPVLIAAAFSALGFLPAVVVHTVLRTSRPITEHKGKLLVTVVAYSTSGVAATLHFYSAVLTRTSPSPFALLILTLGFSALIIPLILLTGRQPGWSRAGWIVALSIFAVSALHLSNPEGDHYSWPIELIGHHASLPLALAILYQDYRFALADIFLKRALTLLVLVSLAFGLYVTIAAPLLSIGKGAPGFDPRAIGALLGMWVATALLYPTLQRVVTWFVDKIVLRRADYDQLCANLARAVAEKETSEAILDVVCDRLKPALTARHISWSTENPIETLEARATTLEIIPTAELPRYTLVIGELSSGRRLLSDDTAMLKAVSLIVARRIDALRITHERCEQNLREEQIGKLATEAELRALRAQINPHFLFNALTTIGYLIQTSPDRALDTLMKLTGLLRGVLRSAGEFTTLGEELEIIESYLDIERARFEERLRVTIDVPLQLRSAQIPPLLIQPLIENAIKHGVAPRKAGGDVILTARLGVVSDRTQDIRILCITVRDTGAGVSEIELAHGRRRGLGINNVEQRLKSYYGSAGSLAVSSARGEGTSVEVRLPVVVKSFDEIPVPTDVGGRRRA